MTDKKPTTAERIRDLTSRLEALESGGVPRATVGIGSFVEYRAHSHDEWIPFLVTHLDEDDDILSGVAFTGIPTRYAWSRGAREVHRVPRGDGPRCWRPKQ